MRRSKRANEFSFKLNLNQTAAAFPFFKFFVAAEKGKHLFSTTGSSGGADGCITMETLELECREGGDAG